MPGDIPGETLVRELRIVIADDNAAFLHQMNTLLASEFDVAAIAEDGRMALAKTLQHRPDVVVLDLEMPFLNGIEITRELRKLTPAPAIVICSVESDEEIIDVAREVGALGYVFKKHLARDVVAAVKCAARGFPFVSRSFDIANTLLGGKHLGLPSALLKG